MCHDLPFWGITQRVVLFPYRRFGPNMGPKVCPKTSVRNYHHSLYNTSEEGSFHLLRDGSLKSHLCVVTHLYMKTLYSELEFLVSVCLSIHSYPYLTMLA